MTVEGEIVAIRETWPLQLTVQSGTSRYDVVLRDRTSVRRGGRAVDPGGLRASERVRVTGVAAPGAADALVADAIEVLA
jgi:hypothetical protein